MAVAPVYESMTLPSGKTPRPSSSPCTSPYSSSSNEDASKHTNSSVHLLPKNSNISIFSSLKRKSKKRKKKKDDRSHNFQKIMGEEQFEEAGLQPACEPVVYDTHTWPLKERRKRKNARKPNSDGAQVLDHMKNPLMKDIDAESSVEVGSPVYRTLDEDLKEPTQAHVKNHCRFLSLGSVLSFDLPTDMSLIPDIQDVITIGPAEPKKISGVSESQINRPTALSTFKTARSTSTRRDEVKRTSSEITLRIDCKDVTNISVDTFTDISSTEEDFPPPPSPVVEDICVDENQTSSPTHMTDIQIKSGISGAPKEEPDATQSNHKEDHNVCPAGPNLTMAEIHICPSAHTLVHNLNEHVFHRPAKISSSHTLKESPIPPQNHASHVMLNFRTNGREDSVDSGHSSSGSFKLCAEGPYLDTSECPGPKRTIVKMSSMEAVVPNQNLECFKEKRTSPINNPVHPDHQQFEQEEEELEDIWNHTKSYRQSACSDIMYNGYQALPATQPATHSSDQQREPSPKEQAVLFRELITASAPNLLVAEFRLPPSVQTVVCGGKQQSSKEELCILGRGDRRSWAAFTQQEQVYRQVAANETASDPVKLPNIKDQQKYIYYYKEEEEEKEEETGFLKESTGLSSVHKRLEEPDLDSKIQNVRQELPSMEGTLERKHKLQLGGKKASSRGWSSCHAVLYKQTLCFYQDRSDTLRSCGSSVPLTLSGAACEPSPDYTKKPNCFCLRLRDGSEYLLSASSRFLMRKWIIRIQEHIASSESGASLHRCSPHTSSSSSADKCLFPMRNDVTSAASAKSQTTSDRETTVHTGEGLQVQQRQQDLSISSSSYAGHHDDEFMSAEEQNLRQNSSGAVFSSVIQGWTSEKRRSHSFTSATYQKIKPVLAPPTGRDQHNSSSYSVTLFIGDGEMASLQKSPVTAETISELPLRSCTTLPRPQNKSVFRKFFGKKSD